MVDTISLDEINLTAMAKASEAFDHRFANSFPEPTLHWVRGRFQDENFVERCDWRSRL
jgi:hypothetical protein